MKKLFTPLLLLTLLAIVPVMFAQDDEEDVIEIDFVHIFSDDLRPLVIQEIADEFMAQNPGIVVNTYSTNADSDYEEVFLSALDNADLGDAPNVVQVEEGFTQQAIDFGYFVPISELASEEQMATLDDILPSILDFYQIDDQLWSMPWNVSNPILYYNQDAFAAAGLDVDDPPATFEEILSACEAIMPANEDLAACINWPMSTWFVEQWISLQGGQFVNNDNGRSGRATETFFDSPELQTIVNWWDELDANEYYTYTGRLNDDNGEGIAFLTGRTAMTIASSAGISLFQNFAQFELGIAPLPLPSADVPGTVTVGGASVWVMADQTPEEMQASVDFIFFLTQTQNDVAWHKGTGYIPVRESAYEQLVDEGYYEENPAFEIPVNQFQAIPQGDDTTPGAVIGPSQEVRGQLLSAFQSIINGEDDSEEDILTALTNAKSRADEELADYNQDFE